MEVLDQGIGKVERVKTGPAYGFNKDYKIDPTDRWTDTNSIGFKTFRLESEKYILSAKPMYAGRRKAMMQYVQFEDNVVDLTETTENGELVHKDILDEAQNAEEVDARSFTSAASNTATT